MIPVITTVAEDGAIVGLDNALQGYPNPQACGPIADKIRALAGESTESTESAASIPTFDGGEGGKTATEDPTQHDNIP